ncbi:transposase [Xenorhabdus bovienii str. oregonense]|uniref:Transposase n=1 Tax=Xenorhabdus bovienii str. oregonense TaxID=1398202 RepID=A0A077P2U6_XENBV|nr:AAA family ATPase [Xenorhabdus bovienii]CDH05018.1 transposase [Xenorhabdus bovienii str. oregonense]
MSTITELNELMEEKGFSQAQVARGIGRSTAMINQYLQGKYNGDTVTLETQLQQFIRRERERAKLRQIIPEFIPTYTARKGLEVIRLAHMDGEINVIYGDAGMGKTMVMREYAKQQSDAILIEADPGYTARVILEELCNRLGVNRRGNLHDMSEACITALRGSGRIILVDEAENLPYRALETLRRIHDKCGVGVVLAGMPRLILNLKGKRGEYKQLYSRVGFALPMGDSLPEADIQQIARSLLPEVDGDDIRQALFKACKGNARRLFKYLRGVSRASQLSGQPVDVGMINEFSKMLIN